MGMVTLSGKQVRSQASRQVTRQLAWTKPVCIKHYSVSCTERDKIEWLLVVQLKSFALNSKRIGQVSTFENYVKQSSLFQREGLESNIKERTALIEQLNAENGAMNEDNRKKAQDIDQLKTELQDALVRLIELHL